MAVIFYLDERHDLNVVEKPATGSPTPRELRHKHFSGCKIIKLINNLNTRRARIESRAFLSYGSAGITVRENSEEE